MDKDRADFEATLAMMRRNHGKNVIIPVTYPVGNGSDFKKVVNVLFDSDIPAEIADQVAECKSLLMDAIAESDEDMMMRYLEGENLSDEEVKAGLVTAVRECKVIPVFCGSATKDIGVTELMDAIGELFPEPLDRKEVALEDGSTMQREESGAGKALRVFSTIVTFFIWGSTEGLMVSPASKYLLQKS